MELIEIIFLTIVRKQFQQRVNDHFEWFEMDQTLNIIIINK